MKLYFPYHALPQDLQQRLFPVSKTLAQFFAYVFTRESEISGQAQPRIQFQVDTLARKYNYSNRQIEYGLAQLIQEHIIARWPSLKKNGQKGTYYTAPGRIWKQIRKGEFKNKPSLPPKQATKKPTPPSKATQLRRMETEQQDWIAEHGTPSVELETVIKRLKGGDPIEQPHASHLR